jgi:hypothetical protein
VGRPDGARRRALNLAWGVAARIDPAA